VADASRRAALIPEAAQVRRGLQVVGRGRHPGRHPKLLPRPTSLHATKAGTPRRPRPGVAMLRAPAGAARPHNQRPAPTMPRHAAASRGRPPHRRRQRLRPVPRRPGPPRDPRRRQRPPAAWPPAAWPPAAWPPAPA
jgi:hypothetical protein